MNDRKNKSQKEKHSSTIPHAGMLEDVQLTPGYVTLDHKPQAKKIQNYSCSYCGVGDGGFLCPKETENTKLQQEIPEGEGFLSFTFDDREVKCKAKRIGHRIHVETNVPLTAEKGVLTGTFSVATQKGTVTIREVDRKVSGEGILQSQTFTI